MIGKKHIFPYTRFRESLPSELLITPAEFFSYVQRQDLWEELWGVVYTAVEYEVEDATGVAIESSF